MFELKMLTNILRARLGLALDPTAIVLADAPDPDDSGPTSSGLLDRALASRPDVRAAR